MGKSEFSSRQAGRTGKASEKTLNENTKTRGVPVKDGNTPAGVKSPGQNRPLAQQKPVLTNQESRPLPSNLPQASSLTQDNSQAKASPGGQNVLAGELFKETAAALGFPKDQLSVALLAFARFLSLSPSLLGTLRREFLTSSKSSKAGLEASALAVTSAQDKGVTLSPEAVERYDAYFDAPGTGGDGGNKPDQEEVPEPEELQAIAEDEAKKDGFLDLMNSIPGKNGQYWAVFPFSITVRGTELKVFIRILKREHVSENVIADISGPKTQWRCFLKENAGKIRADLRVYPELSARALTRLRKEAERYLGGNSVFEEILVGNREELCDERLPSINKEV